MPPIRLIAVDLDGTLLTSARTLAPGGVAALRRAAERGVWVVVATARALDSAAALCAELGIPHPLICYSGAQVYERWDGPLWEERGLPPDLAVGLAEEADRRGWTLRLAIAGHTVLVGSPAAADPPGRLYAASHRAALALGDPLRILVPRDVDAVRAWLAAQHPGRFSLTDVDNPDYTERWGILLATGADKGSALEAVASRLGVPREERMAIGDDLVDQAMFAHAGLAVAMGNARAEVRAAADHVAPIHDQEGVAWAVERHAHIPG